MNNKEFARLLQNEGLVAVIRGKSADEGSKIVDACYLGGVVCMEITFTVPSAEKLIAEVAEKYDGTDMVVGAGTVLNIEMAEKALRAGAEFIVSPCYDKSLQDYMNERQIAYAPGILTPTEYYQAVCGGAEIVKLFPGDVARPEGLKAIRGPFPDAKIMPTGGVSYDNLDAWFQAGAVAVGAGGNLTKGAKTGDYDAVRKEAVKWTLKIKEIMKK